MARILVLGAGFAGLWAAAAAARKLQEFITFGPQVEILVIDRNPYHNIRVRNYESDLSNVAIPLSEILDPIGVSHLTAEVEAIDVTNQRVAIVSAAGPQTLTYDRLVLALGSELLRPNVPGSRANGFDVDTYGAAVRLNRHLAGLTNGSGPGRSTVVVVGGGFTGIEVATEMPSKLGHLTAGKLRVVLVDSNVKVGATIGDHARPAISEALSALRIETRLGSKVANVDAMGISLESGESIATNTIVWCAGMRASPLTATLPVARDPLGRIAVDQFMSVIGLKNVFAAGDVASSVVDGAHRTVMSCQFARPMGRFAGNNVVADLFGRPQIPLRIDWYVTVLDLGTWGALYTIGWERELLLTGGDAKRIKQTINQRRIYPPRTGKRDEIFAAAAPIVQAPPQYRTAAAHT
jgi:NADH dehydrogenase